jgi:hypothetical protein
MGKALTPYIQTMLTDKDVKMKFILLVNGHDYSSYLISHNISTSKEFGSAQATFVLNNENGVFGESGNKAIFVGNSVSFSEYYGTDTTQFSKFYGQVRQRAISKSSDDRRITLLCLDNIACLQDMDIDLEIEGTKIEVTEEVLTPNFLPAPNDSLAQIFNFANNNIASNPLPIISIRSKDNSVEDPQYDGFDILYDNGQLKLGAPLNALHNYNVVGVSYYFYVKGVYAEDIIQTLLIEPDGYGNYLFGETSAQAVIDNHLTDTFNNLEGLNIDYLTPNYTSSEITIETSLVVDVSSGDNHVHLLSINGLPQSGQASINGDIFTWTSISSANTLRGIPTTGPYSLKAHKIGSVVKYEATYSAGQVWYLKYSNIITDLVYSNFSIPGGTFNYFDKRFGRIILTSAISTSATVKCTSNYSFCTLQASGIALNAISFGSRQVENRLEAVKKLRNYLAPNYIIRTRGDNKIWSSYLSQKVNEDYTLQLATQLSYMEDEDLYTRVVLYTKNKNPTNLMLSGDCSFIGTGEPYKAIASASELMNFREEGNYYVYGLGFSGKSTSVPPAILSKYPTVAVNDNSVGTFPWSNVSNVCTDDVTYASCPIPFVSDSNYLKVSGFGFNLPTTVFITGVSVVIKHIHVNSNEKGYVRDKIVKLLIDGVPYGNNYAKTGSGDKWLTTAYTYNTYGSSSDLWGIALTPAMINSANFGVVLSVSGVDFIVGQARVDSIFVTVAYTLTDSYGSSFSSVGKITANTIKPIIYINEVPVDNVSHAIVGQQVAIEVTTKTDTTTTSGGK